MNYPMMEEAADLLGIEIVPKLFMGTIMDVADSVRFGFNSTVALSHGNWGVPAEGLVGRPALAMFDQRGNRIIAKLKTKDFSRAEAAPLVKPYDSNPDHDTYKEV
jgi:hypothetical protein